MSKDTCGVIQDLLPLYIDEACSDQSKELIIEHLTTCAACTAQLKTMKNELSLPLQQETEEQDVQAIQSLAKVWRKTKRFAWIKGIIVATLTCALFVTAYLLLTEWKIKLVPAENFEVSHVYQLSDGSITYWLRATDGYELQMLKPIYDEQGNAYIQGYRPIVKRKATITYGLHNYIHRMELNPLHRITVNETYRSEPNSNDEFTFSLNQSNDIDSSNPMIDLNRTELKAIYYGTKDDHLLIWKEGMEVPQASEELEKYWFDQEQIEKHLPNELLE
ncbi:zf-HC2 domain-containing protein [Paenibacillus camelliae]|uniref:zf-HC2 domain-containing protein n=1 Tax=Paenibacillus camelliae TaxID=512410 RepID=UPI0020413235|nr:zf-HC2 domain-containing protein [Paenibacillus camelliae]MCM3635849.1 zf-HC2 domain-containing protein [Paenibacillus camelliae]